LEENKKCKIKIPSPNKTEHAIEVHLYQKTWQHTSCEVPTFIARGELRTGQYLLLFNPLFVSQKSPRANSSLPPPQLITHQPTYLPTHLPKPLPTHLSTHLPIKASTNPLPYPIPTYLPIEASTNPLPYPSPTYPPPIHLPTHHLPTTHPSKPLCAKELMQYFLWKESWNQPTLSLPQFMSFSI
jgi:hypothetical protein